MSRPAPFVPEPRSSDPASASGPTDGHGATTPQRDRPRNGWKRLALKRPRIVTGSMLAAVLVALALSAPAVAPTADSSAAWPSKRDARRVAVHTATVTCGALAWCTGAEVVPADRCRRAENRTVYCAVAFFTAQRERCGGVVGVRRDPRRGRLDKVMAVPQDCSADQPLDGPSTTHS